MSQTLFSKYRVLWMDWPREPADFAALGVTHCCQDMTDALVHACDQHADPFDCPDMLLCYCARFREYGLIIHDGGASFLQITACPWCGTALPASLRDDWFDALEAMGIDPAETPGDIPPDFTTAAWWQQRQETR